MRIVPGNIPEVLVQPIRTRTPKLVALGTHEEWGVMTADPLGGLQASLPLTHSEDYPPSPIARYLRLRTRSAGCVPQSKNAKGRGGDSEYMHPWTKGRPTTPML